MVRALIIKSMTCKRYSVKRLDLAMPPLPTDRVLLYSKKSVLTFRDLYVFGAVKTLGFVSLHVQCAGLCTWNCLLRYPQIVLFGCYVV